MKAELILGYLKAVDGEKLTIYTTTHTPEGETLVLPSEGLGINEKWFRTWSVREAQFTIIDGVVKDIDQ